MACTQKVLSIFSTNVRNDMKKHRVHTTISAKHWELLKRHTEKFETQQKVIEHALENLENGSTNQKLSPEMHLWMRIGRDMTPISLLHRNFLEALFVTADIEKIEKITTVLKPGEYLVEWYYQKPLKNCSLKEVIDGIIFTTKRGNLFDTINYTEDGNCYSMKINHSLTIKGSRWFRIIFEDLFKAYGVKTESEFSETGVFIKIFKIEGK